MDKPRRISPELDKQDSLGLESGSVEEKSAFVHNVGQNGQSSGLAAG